MIVDYKKILDAAHAAAKAAADKRCEELAAEYPGVHPDHHGACGFAWVWIEDGRHPFVNWCKKQIKSQLYNFVPGGRDLTRLYGDRHHRKGWQFWGPGYSGQSIDTKELASIAFATSLQQAGIPCSVGSRLD